MSAMNPIDPNFRVKSRMNNPLAWVAGVVAAILVVMLIASYINNNHRNDRFAPSRNTTDNRLQSDEILPDSTDSNQDAH